MSPKVKNVFKKKKLKKEYRKKTYTYSHMLLPFLSLKPPQNHNNS